METIATQTIFVHETMEISLCFPQFINSDPFLAVFIVFKSDKFSQTGKFLPLFLSFFYNDGYVQPLIFKRVLGRTLGLAYLLLKVTKPRNLF